MKGHIPRPCPFCQRTIHFEMDEERTKAEGRTIRHWVNEDGSHHKCTEQETSHLREILSECRGGRVCA